MSSPRVSPSSRIVPRPSHWPAGVLALAVLSLLLSGAAGNLTNAREDLETAALLAHAAGTPPLTNLRPFANPPPALNTPSAPRIGPRGGCPDDPPIACSPAPPPHPSLTTPEALSWVGMTPVDGPPSLYDAASAYDYIDHYLVVFGGCCLGAGYRYSLTWTLTGNTWTQLSIPGPGPREGASMVYDPMGPYVLLFGGCCNTTTNQPYSDTWAFLAGKWSELPLTYHPPAQQGAAIAFDAADQYVALLSQNGSSPHSATWRYVPVGLGGGNWTSVPLGTSVPLPAARYYGSMVYDSADGYVVLFGGCQATNVTLSTCYTIPIGVTWTYLAGHWTLLNFTGKPKPSARLGASMAYDSAQDTVLLFGGWAGGPRYLADTWNFSAGNWTRSNSSINPSPRELASLAFDNQTNFTTLVGGFDGGATETDEWAWTIAPVVGIVTAPSPPVTDAHVNMTFNGSESGGAKPYSLHWNFGDASRGAVGSSVQHNFSHSGTYTVNLTGEDSDGLVVNATTIVSVHARPGSFFLPKQEQADANFSENFTSVVNNGTRNFTYSWSFGDGATSSMANPSHAWLLPNQYLITLNVTDARGQSSVSSGNYTVNPDPVVVYFGANVTAPVVGVPFEILTLVEGGWGNTSYGYTGMPAGCQNNSNRSPVIYCLIYTSGTYPLHVQMHDEEYLRARANYTLVVSSTATTQKTLPSLHLSDTVLAILIGLLVALEGLLLLVAYVTWRPAKKKPPASPGPWRGVSGPRSGSPPPRGVLTGGPSGSPSQGRPRAQGGPRQPPAAPRPPNSGN